MKLYKYKSLDNLWQVLDIVINQRVYCARWHEMNDPLEGKYEIYLRGDAAENEEKVEEAVNARRDELRIGSFSAEPDNFLLWSHYADGHKGCAVEVEIDHEDNHDLIQVTYTEFSSVIQGLEETELSMYHLFNSKGEEWGYEAEWRVITHHEYYPLDGAVTRVLVGPMVDSDRLSLLRAVLPAYCEVVETELDKTQGTIKVMSRT